MKLQIFYHRFNKILILPAVILTILLITAQSCAAQAREKKITVYDGLGIVQEAQEHLGIPYKSGGTTPAGFDCSGFVQYIYKKGGITLPRQADEQYNTLDPIKVPRPGDLVFFSVNGKKIDHVGIYSGDYRFIHSPSSGKTVSYADIRIGYWKERYAGARTPFLE
jgi:cell wall-associated NlpC family hydrolase